MKKPSLIYPLAINMPPRLSSKVQAIPTKDEVTQKLRSEIVTLRHDVSCQRDRMRRLREEIEYEISIWSDLLDGKPGVTLEFAKRRLSQLKGALEYQGIAGFADEMKER